MQEEDFIKGYLRVSQAEQQRTGITEADLGARDWARGHNNDFWIKPGSETEATLSSRGVVFGQ